MSPRVDMSLDIMGYHSTLPFFIAPAALAKLGHPDGEFCLARAAAQKGIPYCVSTSSSISHEELAEYSHKTDNQGNLFFQLYVAKKRREAAALISRARELGFNALIITVDTPVVGKREEDERFKAELLNEEGVEVQQIADLSPNQEAPILRGVFSSTLNWKDLKWICSAWQQQGPVILKGIQSAEDALLACKAGVDGIYLSNHGGRQVDSGPSSLRTLLEIRKFCPEVLEKVNVYLDGGVRRGTDIIKACCLGARGVGLGRPFMYALGAYGTEGVLKAIQRIHNFPLFLLVTYNFYLVLSDEIETTMRLIGVTSIRHLTPDMVNTTKLEWELPSHLSAFKQLAKL